MNSMLIWINGAHGAGKTSVGRRLARMRPGAELLDVEQVCFMLRRIWPDAALSDFKDLPIWRNLTLSLVRAAVTERADRTIIVPMTLDDRSHFAEIVGGLREAGIEVQHFTLTASADTLRKRLWRRLDWPHSRRWAQRRAEASAESLRDSSFAIHIMTEGRSVSEIAAEVLARADAGEAAATEG